MHPFNQRYTKSNQSWLLFGSGRFPTAGNCVHGAISWSVSAFHQIKGINRAPNKPVDVVPRFFWWATSRFWTKFPQEFTKSLHSGTDSLQHGEFGSATSHHTQPPKKYNNRTRAYLMVNCNPDLIVGEGVHQQFNNWRIDQAWNYSQSAETCNQMNDVKSLSQMSCIIRLLSTVTISIKSSVLALLKQVIG